MATGALDAAQIIVDEKIADARREKESAIDAQDFEKAASLRDKEKQLVAQRAEREKRNPPISADNYERTSRQGAVDGCAMLLEAIRKHHPERLQLIVAKTNGLR